MRLLLVFLLFTGLCSWYACNFDGATDIVELPDEVQTEWRRTDDGWIHVSELFHDVDDRPPSPVLKLHPCLVAVLQLLLSIAGLLVFQSSRAPIANRRPALLDATRLAMAADD